MEVFFREKGEQYTCYPFGKLKGTKEKRMFVYLDKVTGPDIQYQEVHGSERKNNTKKNHKLYTDIYSHAVHNGNIFNWNGKVQYVQ